MAEEFRHAEMVDGHLIALCKMHGPLDTTLQLPDIARPAVALYRLLGLFGYGNILTVPADAVTPQEVTGEQEDVITPIPKG